MVSKTGRDYPCHNFYRPRSSHDSHPALEEKSALNCLRKSSCSLAIDKRKQSIISKVDCQWRRRDVNLVRFYLRQHPPMKAHGDDCAELHHITYTNLVLSLFIAVGIVISYFPQHYRIISRRSVEGISPVFLLFGVTSGACALFNILMLQKHVVTCCPSLKIGECLNATLGIVQIGLQFGMFTLIFLLYLCYIPPLKDKREILAVTFLTSTFVFTTALLSFYFTFLKVDHLRTYANALGILGAVLASVQYIPQIYMTYKLAHVGSLSIPMMCLQVPGGALWAYTLAVRRGTSWSTWSVYAASSALQGVLLAMCVVFEVRDRRKGKFVAHTEERPLLVEESSDQEYD